MTVDSRGGLCVSEFPHLFTLPHAESEVCKLETLLQAEVSVVTTGEAVGADTAKTPPALRRRKRTCSRRQGERERERDGGGVGPGERGDRGVGEERERREASKSARTQFMLKCFGSVLEFQSLPPALTVMQTFKKPESVFSTILPSSVSVSSYITETKT